jgi:hypothetical protein
MIRDIQYNRPPHCYPSFSVISYVPDHDVLPVETCWTSPSEIKFKVLNFECLVYLIGVVLELVLTSHIQIAGTASPPGLLYYIVTACLLLCWLKSHHEGKAVKRVTSVRAWEVRCQFSLPALVRTCLFWTLRLGNYDEVRCEMCPVGVRPEHRTVHPA